MTVVAGASKSDGGALRPIHVDDGIVRFRRIEPSGWELGMMVVSLPDGGTLVHSPTWLGDGTFEAIEKIGTPRVLFAPNHYHHLSLVRYRERFPEALATAADAALPRLRKKGHAGLVSLADTAKLLPHGARYLVPSGLRNGEAWLSLPAKDGRAWLVCDAFFHVTGKVRGPVGWALRATATVGGLRLGETFRWLAIADRRVYRDWALCRLAEEEPSVLVVSHGDPLVDHNLADRLASVMHARLDD